MVRSHWLRWILSCCLWTMLAGSLCGEVPRNTAPEKGTLQAVLDRIHNHAAGDAWRKEGWRDDAIESYLDKLVASIAVATENKDLKLPVRLADVKPPVPGQRIPFQQVGQLLIGTDLKVKSLRRSIILADGSVELQGIPEECVIVARHAIVGQTNIRKCVLVAGVHFFSQFDGEPDNAASGSIIVTRGRAEMTASWGSLIASGDGIRLDMCQNTTFLNSGIQGRDQGGSRSVRVPDLTLQPPPLHPIVAKVEVMGVVSIPPPPPAPGPGGFPAPVSRSGRNLHPTGIVFRFGERRRVANVGEPIVDDLGNEVPELKGWQLGFVTDSIAIFRNGESDAVLRIEGK